MNSSRLYFPQLGRIYDPAYQASETMMRVLAGILLTLHGYGKIIDPFGTVSLVESLGFYPGVIWSPLLAATEFFGGILIAIGLFTRPASLAAAFVLLVTVYFHWIVKAEGLGGSEKSILWTAILLFFAARGGNRHSIDARLIRNF